MLRVLGHPVYTPMANPIERAIIHSNDLVVFGTNLNNFIQNDSTREEKN